MVEAFERFLFEHDKGRYSRAEFDRFCAKEKVKVTIPLIHITGSNGKGSTAYFLMHILMAEGYKVGAFIKPAFYEANECILLNGKPIPDEKLGSLFAKEEKAFEKYNLSAFEATVVLAYHYFEEVRPDILIVEAGMGGQTDATNLEELPTILSIITSVSLEHTAYLGTTVSQIALSKAGIIRYQTPLLCGKLPDNAKDPIREVARDYRAPYYEVDDYHFVTLQEDGYHFDYRPYKDLVIPSRSKYQLLNASLAIEATKLLQGFRVGEQAIRKGLALPLLGGRFEEKGNIIFDGAHNPEATLALMETLKEVRFGRPVHVLFASMRDKNIAVMLPIIGNEVESITLTTFPHFRARNEEDYFLYLGDYPYEEDPKKALDDLLAQYPDDLILVTGSLAFVGFLRRFYL